MEVVHHASGSSGNAVSVDDILIDAGVKTEENYRLLLLTHAHIDHIRYLRDTLERVEGFYTTPEVLNSLEGKISKKSEKQYNLIKSLIDEKLIEKPDNIEVFDLVHDIPCVGYKIDDYVHITDTGVFDPPDFIYNQRFYTIESNYDPVELEISGRPLELIERIKETHMSNEEAIEFATMLKAPEVMFVHLSEETNSPQLAKVSHDLVNPEMVKHYPMGYVKIKPSFEKSA